MARPTQALIDLEAIRKNYHLAKRLAPQSRAMAVVKADAYGHGATRVALALEPEADAFAVAAIEEALELREAGIDKPIMLLEGFFSEQELPLIEAHRLSFVIHSMEQIASLERFSTSARFDVWLKLDIGMHRLGIPLAQFENAINRLRALKSVANLTLMGHFSCADELQSTTTTNQHNAFGQIIQGHNLPISLSNSAAILGWSKIHSDWLRPGLMLYGATPFDCKQENADLLLPAMQLRSKVIAVRSIEVGEAVGYGASWVAQRPSRIGTIAVGYADGYPRQMRSGAPVIVNNQVTQLVGRVSMDMITVDLTDLPSAGIGAEVELFGKQLLASELAPWANTIPYTLFTGITRRVQKVYND